MIRLTDREERILRDSLKRLDSNDKVQRMKEFIQHGQVTTYDHCYQVARASLWINRVLRFRANVRELLTGAMLHDFYLYDWHDDPMGTHKLHGFFHPAKACKNARDVFKINENEQHIIECHMWPLTISKLPRSREAIIVCMADKYCAICETLFKR